MTLKEDVFSKLSGTPAITAIFGTRVFPLRVPESNGTWPALVYQVISPVDIQHTHGALVSPRGRLVQFTVYDTDSKRAGAAAGTLIATLVGRSTWGANDTSCRLADEGEDVDPEPRGLYRARVDLILTSAAV